ncbi:MAG: hypothetical protein IIW27_05355, partial [Clostridia bacterium]|nr:hypothetical protein [Clostridia bacterium]
LPNAVLTPLPNAVLTPLPNAVLTPLPNAVLIPPEKPIDALRKRMGKLPQSNADYLALKL